MSPRSLLIFAGISGMVAVALGAFGAHSLRAYLNLYQQQIFDKGIQYHFIHTLAALCCGIYYHHAPNRTILIAGWLFLLGVLCFSASLYVLATAGLTGFPVAIAGPITPIGGLFFLCGWAVLLYSVYRS